MPMARLNAVSHYIGVSVCLLVSFHYIGIMYNVLLCVCVCLCAFVNSVSVFICIISMSVC